MNGITFLVESCKVNTEYSSIFWNGRKFITQGHLICSGNDHRFLVYFISNDYEMPKPEYIKKYKLGAMFVPYSEMDSYIKLSKESEPIYAYLNAESPELNCLSVNEPVRESIY